MSEMPIKLTKEDLEKQVGIPEVLKKAIEHALFEMAIPEDPEDKVWPDYFRGEVVSVEIKSVIAPGVEVDDDFYTTEAAWFQAGWKAREKVGV